MRIIIYKQLKFKIDNNSKVNSIMCIRGTLYITVDLECSKVENPDLLNYDIFESKYILKWQACNEDTATEVSREHNHDLIDFILNSNFDEEEAFKLLDEEVEYELNYLDKYNVAYHLKNDVAKVEAFLTLVSKIIIKNGAKSEPFDTDDVNELVELIREAINIHEGNTDNISKAEFKKLEAALENGETIEFKYNGLFYEIFDSVSNEGYIVNVYSIADKDENGEYLEENLVDGGLCSGGAEDAILFML
ncbi:hypothetical protein GJV85_03550 [Sulfurimonas aquatica]|uniref:Uncharacterized protein n=1 Tax=Sulfurimonas aquatica TaxID=2672570 RepID=A0A975GC41_9BACT|nr:hypothetical protein [Sulfurimonas aquatica]QSZ41225.1 hypothetical protein GJV85_03550 [Sulfurimonas aquatica]